MASRQPISNMNKSDDYGILQRVVDKLYEREVIVARKDVIVMAQTYDVPLDLTEIVELLPPGEYDRAGLCVQLNSSIAGHAWGQVYGTVE